MSESQQSDRGLPLVPGAVTPGGTPPAGPATGPGGTIYQRLGEEAFWRIARAFYARIERHPTLRSMFPADLSEPIRNQAEFLMQYFGGPQAYSARKGHPRLRLRHMPFKIDVAARNAWVETMSQALADAEIPAAERAEMLRYFEQTATFMINAE